MKHDNRYVWLDLARGITALLVCAGHLRAAMFVDYKDVTQPSGFSEKLFYIVTSLGHQAVVVFFVLSGFFVGGSVLKNANDFRFLDYYTARLSRLWMVLVPALFFTLLVDKIIAVICPGIISGDFKSTLDSGPTLNNYSQSIATFF